jgi:Helix-turn-helix domain
MSTEAMCWALGGSSRSKHSARLVLIVMSDGAAMGGYCTNSIGDLSRLAGLCKNTVKKALRKL